MLTSAGIAGVFSGSITAGGSGVNAGASATISYNGIQGIVNDTITVGGQSIPIVFDSSQKATSLRTVHRDRR